MTVTEKENHNTKRAELKLFFGPSSDLIFVFAEDAGADGQVCVVCISTFLSYPASKHIVLWLTIGLLESRTYQRDSAKAQNWMLTSSLSPTLCLNNPVSNSLLGNAKAMSKTRQEFTSTYYGNRRRHTIDAHMRLTVRYVSANVIGCIFMVGLITRYAEEAEWFVVLSHTLEVIAYLSETRSTVPLATFHTTWKYILWKLEPIDMWQRKLPTIFITTECININHLNVHIQEHWQACARYMHFFPNILGLCWGYCFILLWSQSHKCIHPKSDFNNTCWGMCMNLYLSANVGITATSFEHISLCLANCRWPVDFVGHHLVHNHEES